ncbi:MAG: hypothetical protein Q9195_001844 [Heterodermia aff. obscurata]
MPGLVRIPTAGRALESGIFDSFNILSDGVSDHSVHILNRIVYLEELPSLDTFALLPPACKTSIASPKPLGPSTYTPDTSLAEALLVASSLPLARPLIDPVTISNEMIASTPPVPQSPPALTHSRSSSFLTSSLSAPDAALPDFDHFEDISLVKDSQLGDQERCSNDPSAHILPTMRNGDVPTTFLRDLTVGDRRQAAHDGHGQGRQVLGLGPAHAVNMPKGSNLTRKFSTSSGLARRAMSNHSRSRSPSPSAAPIFVSSPQSLPPAPSRDAVSPPMRASTARRGSWQPNRKTAQELEEEYDDTDEDLPEDASLWNVPLSPRTSTGEMKNFIGAGANIMPMSMSPKRMSATEAGSPQLQSPVYSNSHTISPVIPVPALSRIDFTAEYPLENRRNVSTHSKTHNYSKPNSRAKSWTVAMSELSQDAQNLTEALQGMVDSSAFNESPNLKVGSDDLHRTKMSVDLPPLRIHNAMIDPLPISKEKERVLSRTRPSWLPPKSQKEERKHLKEYQRMMESSLQAGMILSTTKVQE